MITLPQNQIAEPPNGADVKKEQEFENAERAATIQSILLAAAVLVGMLLMACMSTEDVFSGTFGDSFGVLTSGFTGLALVGLWYSIRLQRIELRATRDELEGQKEHLGQQAYALSKQNFENTFFRILGLLEDRVPASLSMLPD
jgi:hypothetical protein